MPQSKPQENQPQPVNVPDGKLHFAALCYGDYPQLGQRLFESWLHTVQWEDIKDVRIGLNAVSDRYRDVVMQYARRIAATNVPVFVVSEQNNKNVYKYPMMRRLFYSAALPPLSSEFIWWWDDDSWLPNQAGIWTGVRRAISTPPPPSLLGHYFYINLQASQTERINKQPWVTKPIKPSQKVKFMQGGCWVARTEFLRKWDYPFTELKHNGGDSILGLLAAQQKAPMRLLPKSIRSNDSARRGETSPWVFATAEGTEHQNFQVSVLPVLPTVADALVLGNSSRSATAGRVKTYS